MILDFTSPKTGGACTLARLAIKRAGGDGGLYLDLDLVAEVTTADDAATVAATVPGAADLYARALVGQATREAETMVGGAAAGAAAAPNAGTYGAVKVRPPDLPRTLTLRDADTDDELARGDVEVLAAGVKATPKGCAASWRVRLAVADAAFVGGLADRLGVAVEVVVETRQGVLPFVGRRRVPGEVGEVVSGVHDGTEYAGVLRGRAHDEIDGEVFEIDDLGRAFVVPSISVAGAIRAVAEDGDDLTVVLGAYGKACKRARAPGSWRYLVAALGEQYLDGGTTSDRWTITADVLARAVALGREAATHAAAV